MVILVETVKRLIKLVRERKPTEAGRPYLLPFLYVWLRLRGRHIT